MEIENTSRIESHIKEEINHIEEWQYNHGLIKVFRNPECCENEVNDHQYKQKRTPTPYAKSNESEQTQNHRIYFPRRLHMEHAHSESNEEGRTKNLYSPKTLNIPWHHKDGPLKYGYNVHVFKSDARDTHVCTCTCTMYVYASIAGQHCMYRSSSNSTSVAAATIKNCRFWVRLLFVGGYNSKKYDTLYILLNTLLQL